ncbi:putative agmatine deiminase [Planobispora rosea]|uniref:Putative agmatine deiminase n=2 Tax=Planobispora rosea TaxID=35762 RepID=A0A8J3WAT3_PLARO|nr:putative agmatine deiminase [Planobispora rosea]GIH83134.1 putative agmatine deiminase [Planobispora rosea]
MFFMPPEWHPHTRTWMSWPVSGYALTDPEASYRAWSDVANTIVRYEPVTMVVDPSEAESAAHWLDSRVEMLEQPLDDCWMRDNGPTFLLDGEGGLAGVDWTFNGWGWNAHAKDDLVAAAILERVGARRFRSELVNEGGGIHVDGEGTVIVTETVQLGEKRNPGWTKEGVEDELRARLGVEKVIWLPRGLTADYGRYGTSGHVDLLASFARPGLVLCHVQPDPSHPDYEVTRENLAILRSSTDARGRPLEVVELLAPETTEAGGELVDYSYINHYLANGLVVLCSFDDPRDAETAEIFARLFPGRAIRPVDARDIFALGGGIHCITQQQPRP